MAQNITDDIRFSRYVIISDRRKGEGAGSTKRKRETQHFNLLLEQKAFHKTAAKEAARSSFNDLRRHTLAWIPLGSAHVCT